MPTKPKQTRDNQTARCVLAAGCLLALLVVMAALNAAVGSVRVPVLSVLFGDGGATEAVILWRVRLPRAAAAAVLGGALALSGFLLQTFFANPIAGPYVLGVSSGAKLAVALAIVFLLRGRPAGSLLLILAAFLGSLLTMGAVLLAARRVRNAAALIVSGVMIGYVTSALTDFVVTFADGDGIVGLHNWSMGSFSGTNWENVGVMTAVVLAASGLAFLLSKQMSAYQLGEGYAMSVGVDVRAFRAALVLLASILAATVTAFAGPVSFVGVAVPHLVKALAGTAKPIAVMPLCFLGGAVFCLGCDLVARTAFAPAEMSVSSVSAVFGAPVVIYMLAGRAGKRP